MGCNCKWCEAVIAIIILVFTIWPTWLGAQASMWIVIISAVALLIHSFACKQCMACDTNMGKVSSKRRK